MLFCAGLMYWLPPSCMEVTTSSCGGELLLQERPGCLPTGVWHARDPRAIEQGRWRRAGFSSAGASAVVVFISHSSPLQGGFSSGPSAPGISQLLPVIISQALLEPRHPVISILSATALCCCDGRVKHLRDLQAANPDVFAVWPFTENVCCARSSL